MVLHLAESYYPILISLNLLFLTPKWGAVPTLYHFTNSHRIVPRHLFTTLQQDGFLCFVAYPMSRVSKSHWLMIITSSDTIDTNFAMTAHLIRLLCYILSFHPIADYFAPQMRVYNCTTLIERPV